VTTSTGRALLLDQTSEREWQAQVRRWLNRAGWRTHCVYNSRRSPEGWPDIFAARNGRAIAMELKVKNNKPTQAQLEWQLELQACGIEAYVFYPRDEERVKQVLA